jgi:antitoxin VapB
MAERGVGRKAVDFLSQGSYLPHRRRKTAMAINIKDPVTEQIVRELATLTGASITEAVRGAAEAQLAIRKIERDQERARRHEANLRLLEEMRALPVIDGRPLNELREDLWDGL